MRKAILFLLNNVLINQFLILLKKDDFIKRYVNNWSLVKINPEKSFQENVGFSHSEQIDLAVVKIHKYVNEVEKRFLSDKSKILDIGCGNGLYLKDFKSENLYGTDLSAAFLKQCHTILPMAKTIQGDYLEIKFENNFFDCIYSISVIEYISPSKIKLFFDKIYSELKPGGIMIIQYPHALTMADKFYSDLSYISYIPDKIEKLIEGKFKILTHEHSFDQRTIHGIDHTNYSVNGERNFCNGMILIAQKK